MKYTGIIFDIDGTAVPLGGEQGSGILLKAINEAQKKGIKVSAATGRTYAFAEPILKNLGLIHPCIIMGGTAIVDPKTWQVLWEKPMNTIQANKALELLAAYATEAYIGVSPAQPTIKVKEYNSQSHSVYMVYADALNPDDAQNVIKDISALGGIVAHGTPSWTKGLVDIHITHIEATKEHAISVLVNDILGLNPREVIGVGDGGNDLPLFKTVGYKVAMGNADDRLKALADEIVPPVEEDGLTFIIERHFLV